MLTWLHYIVDITIEQVVAGVSLFFARFKVNLAPMKARVKMNFRFKRLKCTNILNNGNWYALPMNCRL